MDYKKLQSQYDKIYSYFRITAEQFDYLEWNGKVLEVVNKDITIEKYLLKDLKNLIF